MQLRLQKPLEEYIALVERLARGTLPLIEARLDIFCVLEDPVHRVRGKDEVMRVWARRVECMPQTRFKVEDFAWGRRPATAFIRHTFDKTGGMIEIEFGEDGRVIAHREFWGGEFPYRSRKYARSLDVVGDL